LQGLIDHFSIKFSQAIGCWRWSSYSSFWRKLLGFFVSGFMQWVTWPHAVLTLKLQQVNVVCGILRCTWCAGVSGLREP
jgi:hypothetical protein